MNDADWEKLSGYLDGELPDSTRAEVEARLPREPELRSALAQLRQVKSDLSGLRPEPVPVAVQAAHRSRGTWRPVAAAASVAVIAGVAAMMWLQPMMDDRTTAEWHDELSTTARSGLQLEAANNVVSIPNLSLANLALVASMTTESGDDIFHYSGENGCRLTFRIGMVDDGEVDARSADPAHAIWRSGEYVYEAVATGMDPDRFAAVSNHLKAWAEKLNQSETELAMQSATRAARPCA